jgi:hypothetical protein
VKDARLARGEVEGITKSFDVYGTADGKVVRCLENQRKEGKENKSGQEKQCSHEIDT